MNWKLLVLVPLGDELVHGLFDPLGAEVTTPATRDRSGLHAALADADLVVGDFTGTLALDTAAVAAAPHLAFVQMPQVGVDSCDLASLSAAGVPVANVAGANAHSVAEWALAAALDLSHRMSWADRRMREGDWPQMEMVSGGADVLTERRVGVLGRGAVGTRVIELFEAIGCTTRAWSKRDGAGLDDLLAASDVLVVCLPLTDETRAMLDRRRLALLPRGALLINVARGGIAPDADVLAALAEGGLGGAALDVYEMEPLPADHPFRRQANVILSPHAASATRQAQRNILTMVADNLRAAIAGKPVINVVNDADPVVRSRRA